MLEINNLHAKIDSKPILKGLALRVDPGEMRPSWARTARASRPSPTSSPASEDYEVTGGRDPARGEEHARDETAQRAARWRVPRVPVPDRGAGRRDHDLPRTALERPAQGQGEASSRPPISSSASTQHAPTSTSTQDMLKRAFNVGFSGGEKKRMENLQMAVLEPKLLRPRRDRFRARHRCPEDRRGGRQRAPRPLFT